MPPNSARLKRPVPRPVPQDQEEQDLKLTAEAIIQAISEGVFDTHLDLIDKAITDRIRQSQEEEPDEIELRRAPAEKIRVLRSAPPELVWNRTYRLRGEKYAGVVVTFLEYVGQANGEIPRAKVSVDTGNKNVQAGNVYIVPSAALEEIPDLAVVKTKAPYGHSLKPCRQCGEDVEYSGTGRPHTLCKNCR